MPGLKRYTGDEIHGFMFPDYRSDEPRWIDGKHMEQETILGMARQIEMLLATLKGVTHCHRCITCQRNAEETLDAYYSMKETTMEKNTKVTWTTASGVHGSGITIADEIEGHVMVAEDAPPGEEHFVIWCAVTWLTPATV